MRLHFVISLRIILLSWICTTVPSNLHAQTSKINEVQLGQQIDSLFQMVKVPESLAFAESIRKASQKINSTRFEGRALQWMGKYHLKHEAFELAIATFLKLQKMGTEVSDSLLICLSNFELGSAYRIINKIEKSLQYLAIALRQAKAMGDKKVEGFILNEYGILYIKKGNFQKALTYLVPAKAIMQSVKDTKNTLAININLGIAYTLTGKPANGLVIFFELYDFYKARKDSLSYATAYGNIAFAYQNMGKMQTALMYYDSSIYYATKYHQNKVASISYQDMSSAYMEMGNTLKAFNAFKKYHQLEKSAISEITQERITKLEVVFETAKKERELILAQNQIKELGYLAQIRLQRTFLITGGLIALIIISIIVYLRLKEKLKLRIIEENLVIAELESQRLEAQHLKQNLADKKADLTSLSLNIGRKNDFHVVLIQQLEALTDVPSTNFQQQVKTIINFCNAQLGNHSTLSLQQENINEINHAFFQHLERIHGKFTSNEKYLAGSFRLGFTNKEIANQKYISLNAVKMGRHRLRKKLQLKKGVDLIDYLQKI